MRLADVLPTLTTLDDAYETIGREVAASRGTAPSWTSIVRERPRRRPGIAHGDLQCAKHGGAPHGLPYDTLTDHLASEMSEWVRLASASPTARSILGIERLDESPGSRLGALVHLDEDRELCARFTATGRTLTSLEDHPLWAAGLAGTVSFRERHALSDPHLFYSYAGGKSRRWSFSDVRSGYEEYLRSQGKAADEAALSALSTCPTPKLLGAVTEHNRRHGAQHVPLALSEARLFGAASEVPGEPSSPCEACLFGLGPWMCGQGDMLAQVRARGAFDHEELAEEWVERLRGRAEPGARATIGSGAARPVEGSSGVATQTSAASPGVIVGTAGAIGAGLAAGAAVAPWDRGVVGPDLPDLPERDVTGRDLPGRRTGAWTRELPARERLVAPGERRERIHVRLESSDFPCDDIEIRELSGKEAIGLLFSFHVDIVCPDDGAVDTDKMLGASAALVLSRGGLEVRRIHGMVAQVDDHLESESEWRSYRLWIVPRLWRSTLVETQEVYLDTTVPDLIRQKLALVGLEADDVEMRLTGNYPVRELVVQYKETDVAFVSRLCEHLGLSFFFEHEGGADKVVFTDSSSGFRPLSPGSVVQFRPRGDKVDVFELEARARAFPASFAMQDYNYRTPTVDLTQVVEAPLGFGGGVVEYGAHVKTPAESAAFARLRAEERQVENRHFLGKSDLGELEVGRTVTLVGHPRLEGQELLLVEVEHHAKQTVKMSGGGGDDAYRASFRAVDRALPYRPRRATPRPRIHGVLTAVVEPNATGEIGESARIDADGRYTVKFYFDAGDVAGRQKSSRPVRMIQPHAGPSYGMHFPLKPGIEVLVVFLDGDPDRPLIVGSVPNPITPSPVVEEVSLMNRIETASGLIIEMRDAPPPLAK